MKSAEITRNGPIFERILTFFPRKSREIGRFFREFAPENAAKFCFFFREISEALQSNLTVFTIHILDKLQNVFLNIFLAQKVGINYQTVFSFSVFPNDARESNVPFFENF